MSTWKSKILDRLGIVSMTGADHGPSGLTKGVLLAATVVAGLSGMANVHADEFDNQMRNQGLGQSWAERQKAQPAEEPGALKQVYNNVLHADSYLLNKAIGQVVDIDKLPPPPEMMDESSSPSSHVFGMAMSGMAATAAAPVMAVWIVAKQVDNTVDYVQERQTVNLNTKMTEVESRMQRVYAESVAEIRKDELRKQGIENPTEEQLASIEERHQISRQQLIDHETDLKIAEAYRNLGLEQDTTVNAAAFDNEDLKTGNGNISDLLNKGKTLERDQGAELSR